MNDQTKHDGRAATLSEIAKLADDHFNYSTGTLREANNCLAEISQHAKSALAAEAAQPVVAAPTEAIALLRIWQTWLGTSREHCDDVGKRLWDRIEAIAQQPASAQPVAVPIDAIMQDLTEAWRLGQAMYQYASKNSKSALHKAHVTQLEFDELRNSVRAKLSAAQKPEGK